MFLDFLIDLKSLEQIKSLIIIKCPILCHIAKVKQILTTLILNLVNSETVIYLHCIKVSGFSSLEEAVIHIRITSRNVLWRNKCRKNKFMLLG